MSLAAKIIPSPAPPRNKFLEDNGDLIFPTLEELCGMTESDKEEWQRALSV